MIAQRTTLADLMQGPFRDWFPDGQLNAANREFLGQLESLIQQCTPEVLSVTRPRETRTTAILLCAAMYAVRMGLSRAPVIVTSRWAEAHWRREQLLTSLRDRLGCDFVRPRRTGAIDLGNAVVDSCPVHSMRGRTYIINNEIIRPDLLLIDGVLRCCNQSPQHERTSQQIDLIVSTRRNAPRAVIVETL